MDDRKNLSEHEALIRRFCATTPQPKSKFTEKKLLYRIVSKGHQSPPDFWYDQDQTEWVFLAKGEARLQFPNETLHLKAGDYVNIPAHQKHRVEWTRPDEETVWLAIFY